MLDLICGLLGMGVGLERESVIKNREQREYENKCANEIAEATAKYGKYGEIHYKTFKPYGGSKGKSPYHTAKIKANDVNALYKYPLTEEEIAAVEWFFRKHSEQEMDRMTAIKYRLDTGKYLEEVFFNRSKGQTTYAQPFIRKK